MKEEKHLESPAESARTTRVLEDKFSEKRLKDPRTNIRMNVLRYSKVNHSAILGKRSFQAYMKGL